MLKKEIFAKAAQNQALDAPIKFEIATKEVITMGVGNTVGASAVTVTENTNIISTIRKREMRYLAHVSVGTVSGNRALWIEEQDEQGNPLFIAEGATKPQVSAKYVEQSALVKKSCRIW